MTPGNEWSGRCVNTPGPGQHLHGGLTMRHGTRSVYLWMARRRVRAWNRVARLAETKTRDAYDRLVDLEQA